MCNNDFRGHKSPATADENRVMTDGGVAVGAQSHLFDEPDGASVTVETSGRVIRPFVALPAAIDDEACFEFDDGGVSVAHVDPVNVAQIQTRAYPDAFDAYSLADGGFTAGMKLAKLRDQLANARKGKRTDDAVAMDIDGTRTLVTTEREYDQTTLTQTNEVLNLNPDEIREGPDSADLDHVCRATIDVPAFEDALESIKRVSDHVTIIDDDGRLVFASGKGAVPTGNAVGSDDAHTVADFGAIVETGSGDAGEEPENEGEPHWGVYSLDYLTNMADALSTGLIEAVELRWSRQFPIEVAFERYGASDELLYEGEFLLAPRRIQET